MVAMAINQNDKMMYVAPETSIMPVKAIRMLLDSPTGGGFDEPTPDPGDFGAPYRF